ncbi:hypothetical protein [uncultured Methanomethylovorans sp.]|uniref:hypothetical protein n=1 Tax=uncultured Methanomethylovorans sp. TaxID=183759 RepID=UPI002AA66379|nr:hypothetical protein [uncultured Methanomethylovorans sp.]
MVEMYQENVEISSNGDSLFDQEIYVKGDLINKGSGDLELDSGMIEGNFKHMGTGDIKTRGTIIIGGDLVLQGVGDVKGDFIVLGKLVKIGSGDVSGSISASGYNIGGCGDFLAKRAPLTADALEKIKNSFGVISNLKPSEQDKANESIEQNLKLPFDQIAKQGIIINVYGDYVENGGVKTGDIRGEYVDIASGSASISKKIYQNTGEPVDGGKQSGELIAIDIVRTLNELREHCDNDDDIFSICLKLDVLSKKFTDQDIVNNILTLKRMLKTLNSDDFAKPKDSDKKRITGVCKYIEDVYLSNLIHGSKEQDKN